MEHFLCDGRVFLVFSQNGLPYSISFSKLNLCDFEIAIEILLLVDYKPQSTLADDCFAFES